MRVLVAPGAFSGTVTAVVAARALAEGWVESAPSDAVMLVPMSDGGAGLLEVVAAARGGRLVHVPVPGPLGGTVPATVLHVPGDGGGTAYVEAGQVLGSHLVKPGQRATAAGRGTSAGLGHLLAAAVATGAGRVVVGLPARAATHDAGAGVLAALAGPGDATVPDPSGPGSVVPELTGGGSALGSLAGGPELAATLSAARKRLAGIDVVLALAGDEPLLGLHGAGAVLGQDPEVGAAAAQDLERALGRATDLLERAAGTPTRAQLTVLEGGPGSAASHDHRRGGTRLARSAGSGAGGGSAFALRLLGARALDGADVVAAEIGLQDAVAAADLVLTGERVLDAPALTRSVTATVARAALPWALPVVAVADEVHTSRREVSQIGISATYEVADRGPRSPRGPVGAGAGLTALRARGARLARTWSV